MRVSAIIPCYNAAGFVREALRSVADQSLPPVEIIVVDDGSRDDTVEVVRASGLMTRILHTKRANAAGARNAGLYSARGDWVAFLDADNRWLPEHLRMAASTIGDGPDVAYDAHHSKLWPDGRVTCPAALPLSGPVSGLTHETFFRWFATRLYGFPTSGFVVRRDVAMSLGGFDVTQVRRHDWEFFLRVIHSRTWAYSPIPTWIGRAPRPGDISGDYAKCKYYELRGILLNERRYAGPAMQRLIPRIARGALVAALATGNGRDVAAAMELGRSRLRPADRFVLGRAARWPSAASAALAEWRRWRPRPRAARPAARSGAVQA